MFAFAFATLSIVSCKEADNEKLTPESVSEDATVSSDEMHMASFACPMDCEEGKTYEAAGKCPVCEMDLVENTDAHSH